MTRSSQIGLVGMLYGLLVLGAAPASAQNAVGTEPASTTASDSTAPSGVGTTEASATGVGGASPDPAAAGVGGASTAPAVSSAKAKAPESAGPFDPEQPFLDAESAMLVGQDTPPLELYGFADFSYFHMLVPERNLIRQYVQPFPSFYVGHLNLYLSSNLGENWRSLAEVRFTYAPHGEDRKPNDAGGFVAIDNTTTDYAELQREFAWGGVEVQRVWVEYQPYAFLTIRAGQWLTPYGFWNVDHGSPTIIAVHKPFPIGDQFFPEQQTGLMLHGNQFIDSTTLGYALTLSNGRGRFAAFRDLDSDKALGGRVFVDLPVLGNLTLGLDVYSGKVTDSDKLYRIDTDSGDPVVAVYRSILKSYRELSYGANLRWIAGDLHVQGELLFNEAVYDDAHRPERSGFDPRPLFAADYRRMGGYVLAAYRTPWLNLMPYAMYEHSSYTDTEQTPPVSVGTFGLNLRATPNVVVKAELATAEFHGEGSTGMGRDELTYFGSQVAWAF
jgi:hypothetical protein